MQIIVKRSKHLTVLSLLFRVACKREPSFPHIIIINYYKMTDNHKGYIMGISLNDLQSVRGINGVYFLYEDNEIVYIGRSGNIYTRLLEHIVEDKKKFSNFKAIKIAETGSEILEVFLISKLKPKYNNLVVNDMETWTRTLPKIAEMQANKDLQDAGFIRSDFIDNQAISFIKSTEYNSFYTKEFIL